MGEAGWLREGKIWANLPLKSKYQLMIKVTSPFRPLRKKRAIPECVGAAGQVSHQSDCEEELVRADRDAQLGD